MHACIFLGYDFFRLITATMLIKQAAWPGWRLRMARADSGTIVAGLPLSQSEMVMNAQLLLPDYNKFNILIENLQLYL